VSAEERERFPKSGIAEIVRRNLAREGKGGRKVAERESERRR